jgi:hypothetical protein
MGEPNQTTSRTSRAPSAKGGRKPLGCLFPLIILVAACAGLFWFWKNKQGDGNNDFLTSLKLPTFNRDTQNSQPAQDQGFSQTQPFNQPQRPPANNKGQRQTQTKGNPLKRQIANSKKSQRVPSGYPVVAAGKQLVHSQHALHSPQTAQLEHRAQPHAQYQRASYRPTQHQQTRAARKQTVQPQQSANKLVNYQWFVPSGIIKGTLQSLIAYQGKANKLASRPDQIITFNTQYYGSDDAIDFATKRLAAVGYKVVELPIDDYDRGGSTVIEALDAKNNQIFLSIKPKLEARQTAWKVEVYKADQ